MHMTPTSHRSQTPKIAQANCLGCSDCKGLCQQLLDLIAVPEAVLHRSNAVP